MHHPPSEQQQAERPDTIVVGAGVSGLTSAVVLAERGHRVEIVAEAPPEHTTSSVAAALFHPYKTLASDRIAAWTRISLTRYRQLTQDPGSDACGVRIRPLLQPSASADEPWWAELVPERRWVGGDALPTGIAGGIVVDLPVIESPVYLPYLLDRFRVSGGKLVLARVDRLLDLAARTSVIVNCCGLGASAFGDDALYPIRGQVLRVEAPGIDRSIMYEDEPQPTYVIPRRDGVILGGTSLDGDGRSEVRPADTEAILHRCARFHPELAQARQLEVKVGLRPGRHAVRLEEEIHADGITVIHNYGHGGAGFTVAWGCAREVADLAAGALARTN